MKPQLTLAVINIFIALIGGKFQLASAKGPHHPRGNHSRKLDEHFHVKDNHIQEDLKQLSISEDELAKMSEEEKNFYFFKLHDSDNNDHLDGLEILHAATHHNDGHVHRLDGRDSNDDGSEDSSENSVIDVIDDFIAFADLDQNGLLTYPEYMKAISTENWNKKEDPAITTSSPDPS
ncbi:multiple coagulation factor deficiency protein 2 homolog [Uranotaenia lowii]|uniref:multiple coagulation factor deficiency protein 2 homolog n=1 Tax=Uranotaenia lowii TaxID=190385 RepID=UPI00247927FF|nr:multiple coagulation factor deficiency protein 2 homolog [Uranotaenia lowii]